MPRKKQTAPIGNVLVQRDNSGRVKGVYSQPQGKMTLEQVREDDPDLVEFREWMNDPSQPRPKPKT